MSYKITRHAGDTYVAEDALKVEEDSSSVGNNSLRSEELPEKSESKNDEKTPSPVLETENRSKKVRKTGFTARSADGSQNS